MGTILTLSGPGIVCTGRAMWRGTNPWRQSNCKTAAWTLQILSPGARSPKGPRSQRFFDAVALSPRATHGSRGRDVGVGGT